MNLLFDFLKYLPEEKKRELGPIKPKGVTGKVWSLLYSYPATAKFNKQNLLETLKISAEHFDKISSELLLKCYHHLFGSDTGLVLEFLSKQRMYKRHFYAELKRQMNRLEGEKDKKRHIQFIRKCFELIHDNLPIADKDESVINWLGKKYIGLFKGREQEEAKQVVAYKILHTRIHKSFAAGNVMDEEQKFEKALKKTGPLPAGAGEELVAEYYFNHIYFYHAISHFDKSLQLTGDALNALKKFKSPANRINLMRLELKSAEYLYFTSRYDESYEKFERAMEQGMMDKIPDRGYYVTKFLQVALITGHTSIAGDILLEKRKKAGNRLALEISSRDILSFSKFYLLTGQYEEAFRFIQLGFEKNPKSVYFQYEVELRNLLTAYFVLSGQASQALEMCDRHIKFLRFHGYGIRTSSYPYFFLLVKAILAKKNSYRNFTAKEEKMLQRYHQSTYALYGKLLLKMMEN